MVKILRQIPISLAVEQRVTVPKGSKVYDAVFDGVTIILIVIHNKAFEGTEEIDLYVIPNGTEMYDTSEIGEYYQTVLINNQTFSIFKREKNGKV